MKLPHFELLFFTLLPFCFGAASLEKAGYMHPQYFPPLTKDEETYEFTNYYTFEHNVSYSRMSVTLTTYFLTGGATKKTVSNIVVKNVAVPCTINFKTVIDYDDFVDGRDRNVLEFSISNTDYAYEFYSVNLAYPSSHYINIDTENGDFDRSGVEGWYEDFSGESVNLPTRYEWKGFTQEITDPEYMLFPLNAFKIRMRNQRGEYTSLPIGWAQLTIFDAVNFKFGYETSFLFVKRRIVPLSWSYDSSNYTVFRMEDAVTYSPDFRIVRENGRITEGDKTSYSLFLPPIENGEVRSTTFKLDIYSAGEQGRDSIHSSFNVIQTHNYIGSYPISEYYVEEY